MEGELEMFCKECGKEITDDSKFCSNCGANYEQESVLIKGGIKQKKLNGNIIAKYSGQTGKNKSGFSGIMLVIGILCVAMGFFIMQWGDSSRDEELLMIGIMIMSLGVIELVITFLFSRVFSRSNIEKMTLEIYSDGVRYMAVNGDKKEFLYERMKTPTIFKDVASAGVDIENDYGEKIIFRTEDQQKAREICDLIQEMIEKLRR